MKRTLTARSYDSWMTPLRALFKSYFNLNFWVKIKMIQLLFLLVLVGMFIEMHINEVEESET
jgi:hypothetical protein